MQPVRLHYSTRDCVSPSAVELSTVLPLLLLSPLLLVPVAEARLLLVAVQPGQALVAVRLPPLQPLPCRPPPPPCLATAASAAGLLLSLLPRAASATPRSVRFPRQR